MKKCKRATLLKNAQKLGIDVSKAMVCYGIDISNIPDPDVGAIYQTDNVRMIRSILSRKKERKKDCDLVVR